jgi:LysR family hydrogen peroxide-inducible transcriptional activator
MKPTIRQLEHLIALHEHGSFSAAAEACFVTQSTLSASIKELENLLGQQLVIRSRKNLTLTSFGLETLDQASAIMTQVATITTRARQLSKPMSGPLRLGLIPTIAPYMLPSILPALSAAHPDLEIQIHEDTTENLLTALDKSQIDLALMAFPYDTPFFAALPRGTSLEQKGMRLKDLEPEKLLLLEDGHCLRDHALEACKLQLPKQKKIFKASSLPTLIEMVRHGYGMTLLPAMACAEGNLPADITILPFTDKPAPSRQIGLCWNPTNPRHNDFKTIGKDIAKFSS